MWSSQSPVVSIHLDSLFSQRPQPFCLPLLRDAR